MDLVVYPALLRAGFKFTPIKKIFAGFMCGTIAMVLAGITQYLIYDRSVCGKSASTCEAERFIPLSVWVQTPTYIFIALSEILASITSLEYAFSKAPSNMRSMVMAIGLFTTAISAAIGEAFLPLSTDPLLEANYFTFAGLAFVAGILFFFCFRKLDKEEDALNQLSAGTNNEALEKKKKYVA